MKRRINKLALWQILAGILALLVVGLFCEAYGADTSMDVDTAVTVHCNKVPIVASADGYTIDETIAYNESGMDLNWNFQTTAGVITQTNITPTSSGVYDWTHVGNGIYKIEITATGGASANNDTEGYGWISGKADAICPFSGPIIEFRAAGINNVLVDGAYSATRGFAGTALPDAAADAAGGLPISDAGGLDMDAMLADTNELQTNQGNWLTATGFSTHAAADVWSVATRALTDKAGFTISGTTQTLDALSTHGDSTWATAAGFSTHAAADVWSVVTRALTDKAGFSLAADQSGVTIGTVNTLIGHTAQTGDTYAALPTNFSDLSITVTAGLVSLAADQSGVTIGTCTTNTDMRGTDGANTTVPDAAGVAPTAIEIQAEMEENGASILDTLRDDLADGGRLDLILDIIAADTTTDIPAKLLKYIQLLVRSDAAIATDNATELTAINADGGSGAGDFSNQTEANEALRDHIGDGTNLTEAGGDGDHLTEAGATGDHLTAINLPNQTMDITGNITGNLSGSVGSVTGAVGSVAGNVDGNVSGSVASCAAATVSAIGANVITDASMAADVDTLVNDEVAAALTTYDPPTDTEMLAAHTTTDALINGIDDNAWDDADRTLTALDEDATTVDLDASYVGGVTTFDEDSTTIDIDGTTVGTCTTNTDMRGTDNAALAATALSSATWTAARAGYIDELAAANIPTDLATIDTIVDSILADTGTDGVKVSSLSASAVDAIIDEIIEGTLTMRQILRILLAKDTGLTSGSGTATIKFRDLADTKYRIEGTITDGNRTSVTLDGS